MSAITLAAARARLQAYLDAEEKVLLGQSATVNGLSVSLADLASIQKGIELWRLRVEQGEAAESGRGRSRNVAPNW